MELAVDPCPMVGFGSLSVVLKLSVLPSYKGFLSREGSLSPYTGCPPRYRTRHFFNNFTTNENIATKFEADSFCKKCDDIITCAGSGHHLRPDRIGPGAPYFGKSSPVRLLSLPQFLP